MTQNDDPGTPTRLVEVRGRQIVARKLNDLQLMLLAREAKKLTKANQPGEEKLAAVARILDLLESSVVQQEDIEYLTDLTVKGELELKDMMEFVNVFQQESAPVPVVRRGRPRKSIS